jgi:hypothetical protein
VVGGSRKIANPASLWASAVLTIGPSVLFAAFLVRHIIAQNVRVKRRSLGRSLRLVGADLYVLGKSPLSFVLFPRSNIMQQVRSLSLSQKPPSSLVSIS